MKGCYYTISIRTHGLKSGWVYGGVDKVESQPLPLEPEKPRPRKEGALYPYLAFSRADVIEGHGTLASSNGDAVTTVAVTNHVEPDKKAQKHPSFAKTAELSEERARPRLA